MPFLWGDPASHFGTENDAVYGETHINQGKNIELISWSCAHSLSKNPKTSTAQR